MRWTEAGRLGASVLAAAATGRAIPLHVTAYVTTRCNLRCVYCSYPYQRHPELDTAEWCSVIDELAQLGTRRISLFGGEPLLRTDLESIVVHAKGRGLRCAMTSNGTLVPRRRSLVRRLDTLTISLDGAAAAHDANRGQGSYEAARRALDLARSWDVPTKVNAVLSANNADQLDWLLAFAEREQVPISLNVMRSADTGLYHDAARFRLHDEALRRLLGRIVQAAKENRWVLFSPATYRLLQRWPDFTVDRLAVGEADEFPAPPCSAGRLHCAIYSDGSLYPCTLTVRQVPARNVRHGVAAALGAVRDHGCASCASACMLETNAMFALRPRVLGSLGRKYLRARLT